ncbi:MAG: DUF4190 domain-containing protein [Verrucomicrobiaceae bacterium]|nr:DUF4190 domain-containing protein [Verrucomicrobiaceae bacterium]
MSHILSSSAAAAKTSGQAIWSLVLGILSMGCLWLLGSIPAILLGIAALKSIDRSGGTLKGRGLGIAGIVTGSVGVFTGILILASLAMPAYNGVQHRAATAREMMGMQQVMLACRTYAADHDGRFPASLAVLAEGASPESALASGSSILYRPGFTETSAPSEILLASPVPRRDKRIVGFSGGNIEVIPEARFQSDYAHLFP